MVHGWKGLLMGPGKPVSPIPELRALHARPLTSEILRGWWNQPGTPLGTERVNPYKAKTEDPAEAEREIKGNLARIQASASELQLEALIIIGGDDTNGAALRLYQDIGLPVVGIPQTMDGDIGLTEKTIGFDTACEMGAECALSQAAGMKSNARCGVLEVYGRDVGHVALSVALAARASSVLIPEVCNREDGLERELERMGRRVARDGWGEVIVAEGIQIPQDREGLVRIDGFGHQEYAALGIGQWVAEVLSGRCGLRADPVQLKHVIRGRSPVVTDIELATVWGIKAVELVRKKRFGRMVAWQKGRATDVDLAEALATERKVDLEYFEALRPIFA
jgi:6-phosphofructokinase 1